MFQTRLPALPQLCTHLLQFEIFPFREHDLIPHHLHSFLCIHGQVSIINSRDIALIHLQKENQHNAQSSIHKGELTEIYIIKERDCNNVHSSNNQLLSTTFKIFI